MSRTCSVRLRCVTTRNSMPRISCWPGMCIRCAACLAGGRDSLRMPCFVAAAGQAVLPAFGEFTGGWMVGVEVGRRLYPVGGNVVWNLPG